MSLVDLPLREAGHSSKGPLPANPYNEEQPRGVFPTNELAAESIYDDLYDMEEQEQHAVAPSPKQTQPADDAPALPQKSALRASRLLEGLGIMKMEATEMGATTPHDLYLSSEEDASSSADDFSDYECDSNNSDGVMSPSRGSYEDTARVVSVVYSGKPSLVDLSLRRRSLSPTSTETHSRTGSSSSKASSASAGRPVSISSSISSILHASPKKADHVLKKRPPFLNLDPFANGSPYSLELPKESYPGQNATPTQKTVSEAAPKPPKTPTQQLVKGVSRTLSLVKKKSRPMLNTNFLQSRDNLGTSPLRHQAPDTVEQMPELPDRRHSRTPQQAPPSPAVTYNDIVKAARKNSVMLPPPTEVEEQLDGPREPDSPTNAWPSPAKRGILSGLAARRRSIKFTGKMH